MERRKFEFQPSYLNASEYLNSKTRQDLSNRFAALRALGHLSLAFNSPPHEGDLPASPENILDEGVFRVGLAGAVKTGVPKWP